MVWQPRFLPEAGRWLFSVDYFKYEQEGIIGLFGEGNALTLDYLLRLQGSSNPNVVRADPTVDDIARYAGTGLAPAGRVLYVHDRYVNLQPQTVRGLDFAASWRSPQTAAGQFGVSINGTHVIEFYRDLSPDIQVLADARDSGVIDGSVFIAGGGDLRAQGGTPEWRWSGTATWRLGAFSMGGSLRYRRVWDTGLADDGNRGWTRTPSPAVRALSSTVRASRGPVGQVRREQQSPTSARRCRPTPTATCPTCTSRTRYWYMSVTKSF